MCECGCGELRALTKLRAPGGWYAVEFYPGCDNCGNLSAAIGVTFIADGSEDEEWLLSDVEEADFGKHGQWGMPVLDSALMRERFAEYDDDADEDSVAKFAFSEFLSRGELGHVHYATVHQFRSAIDSARAAIPPQEKDHE